MSEATVGTVPAIEVHDLEKTYDDGLIHALDGVDLTVAAHEFAAITGHSGCGKSTLLHLVAALDTPTKGSISVNGHDVVHLHHASRFRREEVGLVFQLHNLLPRLSVRENVEIAMSGSRRPHRQRAPYADELLRRWVSGVSATACRRSCRVASVSASPLRGRWPTIHPCCWPTSRPAASTAPPSTWCSRSSGG